MFWHGGVRADVASSEHRASGPMFKGPPHHHHNPPRHSPPRSANPTTQQPTTNRLSVAPCGVTNKVASVRAPTCSRHGLGARVDRYQTRSSTKGRITPPLSLSSPATTTSAVPTSPRKDNAIKLYSIRRVGRGADLPLQAGWAHGGRRTVL